MAPCFSIEKHMTVAQIIGKFEQDCDGLGPYVGFKLWTPTHCYHGILWGEDPELGHYLVKWLDNKEEFGREGPFYLATRRLLGRWQKFHELKHVNTTATPEVFLECSAEDLERADDIFAEYSKGKGPWISKTASGQKRWHLMHTGPKTICRRRLFFDEMISSHNNSDTEEEGDDKPGCSNSH